MHVYTALFAFAWRLGRGLNIEADEEYWGQMRAIVDADAFKASGLFWQK